ncbi:DUF2065 domain-containing protein [Roseivivax sediminis]|uniref:DUF2065 domain-containing protein n=1 Tax=Roseivivax sediminis TaxID=936889 RepID=A0A1I1T4B2_9RHOB|nr:DUF2065 domain-containing protein [Roseivivax sediminis]SFD50170.1 hypothetical protein SAMN04515678_101342 [Roseivivax sediminis]
MDAQILLAMLAGALIVEGLAYALAPSLVERVLEALAAMPLEARRLLGALTALSGVVVLWLAF